MIRRLYRRFYLLVRFHLSWRIPSFFGGLLRLEFWFNNVGIGDDRWHRTVADRRGSFGRGGSAVSGTQGGPRRCRASFARTFVERFTDGFRTTPIQSINAVEVMRCSKRLAKVCEGADALDRLSSFLSSSSFFRVRDSFQSHVPFGFRNFFELVLPLDALISTAITPAFFRFWFFRRPCADPTIVFGLWSYDFVAFSGDEVR